MSEVRFAITFQGAAEVRNLKFEMGAVPRFWLGGRKSVSAFFNNLSIFFPEGERFFIESVRAQRACVRDPKLADEVRTFYGQEGVHTREHIRYNEMLRAHGYPIADMDARVEKLLRGVRTIVYERGQLGVTCALEHFTALMADWLLADPTVLADADENMAALWRWHAAEENEHKAVAFDVFTAAGGTYIERVAIMVLATLIFWAKVAEHQVRLMHADGTLWSFREWAALYTFLFVRPGGMQRLIPAYLSYFRPSFHPWDHDNRALLEAWKSELDSTNVYVLSAASAGRTRASRDAEPSAAE